MKNNYQKPTISVAEIQAATLLAGSVNSVNGNANLNYRGGGSGPARGREQQGNWDDEE